MAIVMRGCITRPKLARFWEVCTKTASASRAAGPSCKRSVTARCNSGHVISSPGGLSRRIPRAIQVGGEDGIPRPGTPWLERKPPPSCGDVGRSASITSQLGCGATGTPRSRTSSGLRTTHHLCPSPRLPVTPSPAPAPPPPAIGGRSRSPRRRGGPRHRPPRRGPGGPAPGRNRPRAGACCRGGAIARADQEEARAKSSSGF
jgi:hypothetical protein